MRNGLLPVLTLGLSVTALAVDITTYHNDNARTGQNLSETVLTPVNVNFNSFGKLFQLTLDGKVDAQPLYLSGVSFPQGIRNGLYVATEHDSVYAFDADTGAQLWKVSLLKAGETPSDTRSCGQVTPEIGITATPVIDRAAGLIYVVAMSKDSAGTYYQRLHALSLTTGAEQIGGPVDIRATFPGTGDNTDGTNVVFDPKQYEERAALLLLNGIVYTSWTSHCDNGLYNGWIIGYSASTLARVRVFNFTPNGHMGSVWMAGSGPAADSNGNIYFLASNGTFDTTLDSLGFPNRGNFGNAFLKLSTANNTLAAADYFNMFNTVTESNADQDLGSGGAVVLPDMTDAGGVVRHLAVGAGKDQHIYLVNRDNMGKFNPTSNNIYQDLTGILGGAVFSKPAYFNGRLYYGAVGDFLKAISFVNARLSSAQPPRTTNAFAYPGTTPSISANGSANGIVWAAENATPAVLHAYDASTLIELYNTKMAANSRDQFGAGNKFIAPMIANGKVYVGTQTGVGVFGLLSVSSAPVITSSSTASGNTNKSFSYQITATNSPASYSATGLPSGLTLNTSSGAISGTPTTAATTSVTIGATNATGTGTASLTITVRGKKN
jgi:outer membrane protein assembly factor BamB